VTLGALVSPDGHSHDGICGSYLGASNGNGAPEPATAWNHSGGGGLQELRGTRKSTPLLFMVLTRAVPAGNHILLLLFDCKERRGEERRWRRMKAIQEERRSRYPLRPPKRRRIWSE
jgi:hypothetical protein